MRGLRGDRSEPVAVTPAPRPAVMTGRRRRRARQLTIRIVAVIVVLIGVYTVWPARLGGPVNYLTTVGSSMEPAFHQGDLAILRPAAHYQRGDVVAYHSRTLDTVVMHRIIGHDGDHFRFKGDHNTWIDPDTPTRDDIIGKLWLRIPHGGIALIGMRASAMFGAIVALLFFAFPRRPTLVAPADDPSYISWRAPPPLQLGH
jgi:signal peptidase I